MDIDITGPNVPKMLGLESADLNVEEGQIHPAVGPHGLKVISMAFLLEDPAGDMAGPDKARGHSTVHRGRLVGRVRHPDHRLRTSDEPLTVSQNLPGIERGDSDHAPGGRSAGQQEIDQLLPRRYPFQCLGVVENMSGYTVRGKSAQFQDFSDCPGGVPIDCQSDESGSGK